MTNFCNDLYNISCMFKTKSKTVYQMLWLLYYTKYGGDIIDNNIRSKIAVSQELENQDDWKLNGLNDNVSGA